MSHTAMHEAVELAGPLPCYTKRFLPELVPEVLRQITDQAGVDTDDESPPLSLYRQAQQTHLSCCLTCSYWHQLFTPALYSRVVIGPEKLKLLLRTLWHTKPVRRDLIKVMMIAGTNPHETPMLPTLPNLVHIGIEGFDFSQSSPILPRIWRLLPCRVNVNGNPIHPNSLPKLIRFMTRAGNLRRYSCSVDPNLGSKGISASKARSDYDPHDSGCLGLAVLRIKGCILHANIFNVHSLAMSNLVLPSLLKILGSHLEEFHFNSQFWGPDPGQSFYWHTSAINVILVP